MREAVRWRRRGRSAAVAFLAAALLAAAVTVAAAQISPSASSPGQVQAGLGRPAPAAAPPVAAPILLAEVASRAQAVSTELGILEARATDSDEVEAVRAALPEVQEQIDRDAEETRKVLESQPTLAVLQERQKRWQTRLAQLNQWLTVLAKRAT
ncbi:MAG: hypothetical protein IH608_01140, partial [Proteobacteria bacterium]|nr:hypothetical protein [Pseudomonadota bacterium]